MEQQKIKPQNMKERMEKKSQITENPVGLFLERFEELSQADRAVADRMDFSYLSADQKAESMWAVFQNAKRALSKTRIKYKDIETDKKEAGRLKFSLGILKKLYDDQETREKYLQANERQIEEEKSVNGNFEKYKSLNWEVKLVQKEVDDCAKRIFSARGTGIDEADILLFETSRRELSEKQKEMQELLDGDPDLGGLAQYQKTKEYARQYRQQKFIWTPSRIKLKEVLEEASLTGQPVLLSGESGTGKTRLVEQASLKLTGLICNETPGKDVRFQDLIARPKISPEGGTYYEYKEIGEAVTGRASTLEEKPAHNGRIVADDEFNLLPSSEQTERLARIASWTPGKKVRMPVTNQEVEVGSSFLYCAMVNLASERYERKKIPPEVLRKFAKVDADYPEQSTENPEIYEMMLAALMDDNGRMRSIREEISPAYEYKEDTKKEIKDGQEVNQTVKIRELMEHEIIDGKPVIAGGFLWRLAGAVDELNKSFSHKETVLKSKGEGQYVRDLIIDMGTILGWLKEYSLLGREKSLEKFVVEKLRTQFLSREAYSKEDRRLVGEFFGHFGIDLQEVANGEDADEKEKKYTFEILTPLEIGLLSPRVKYEKITSEEPVLAEGSFITPEGKRVEYHIKPFEGDGHKFIPGQIVRNKKGENEQFLGIEKSSGDPVCVPYEKKPSKNKKEKRKEDVTFEKAQEILGKDFLGPDQIQQATGLRLERKNIPPIPFSEKELREAKGLGQFLIYRCPDSDGKQLTMKRTKEIFDGKYAAKNRKVTASESYDVAFWENDPIESGWALVSKDFIPDSANKNYLEQTETIIEYLKKNLYENKTLPAHCQEAVKEFEDYLKLHPEIEKARTKGQLANLLNGGDWQTYAKELSELKLNQIFRQTPGEVLYDTNVYYEINGEEITKGKYIWTRRRGSGGSLVRVGYAGAGGARVSRWKPGISHGNLGVFLSRSR